MYWACYTFDVNKPCLLSSLHVDFLRISKARKAWTLESSNAFANSSRPRDRRVRMSSNFLTRSFLVFWAPIISISSPVNACNRCPRTLSGSRLWTRAGNTCRNSSRSLGSIRSPREIVPRNTAETIQPHTSSHKCTTTLVIINYSKFELVKCLHSKKQQSSSWSVLQWQLASVVYIKGAMSRQGFSCYFALKLWYILDVCSLFTRETHREL